MGIEPIRVNEWEYKPLKSTHDLYHSSRLTRDGNRNHLSQNMSLTYDPVPATLSRMRILGTLVRIIKTE